MSDTTTDRPSIDDIRKATDGVERSLVEQYPEANAEQIRRAARIEKLDEKVDQLIEKQNRPPKWARDLLSRVESLTEQVDTIENNY